MKRVLISIIMLLLLLNSAMAAVSFSYTTPLCGSFNGSFTNTSTGTNIAYLWNFGDPVTGINNFAFNATKTTQSHNFSGYGTYLVKLYTLDINSNPVDSVTNTITVVAAPILFLLPNSFPTYCLGDSVNVFMTATNYPSYKYTWNPTPKSVTAAYSVEYRLTQSQTYTVDIIDTVTGCTASKSINIIFNNCTPLTSQFVFTAPPCGQFGVSFSNKSLVAHHYKWYFGDALSGFNDTMSKADTSAAFHLFSDTGVFAVSLVVFDSLETKKDSSVKLVRIYKQSLSKIFNNDTAVCRGSSVILTGTGIGSAVWSPPTDLNTTNGYATIATPAVTTTYYLTTNNNGCIATDSVTITIPKRPDPDFNTDTLCVNEIFDFNANNTTYPFYHWDFGTGDTANGVSALYGFKNPGTYDVKLYVFDGLCDSFTIKKVLVISDPKAGFTPDKYKVEITKANFLFSNSSNNATGYIWDFGDLNTSNDVSPTHTYTDTGWYRVSLTALNNLGCDDTFSLLIRVDNIYAYFVPSAFTPNVGGPIENEVFKIFGPAGTSKFEMRIYNRWGQEIFSADSENTPWEGLNIDGSECPPDDYLYMIRFKDPTGKRVIFKGMVTLIR